MKVYILTIGDEILIGQIIDTNSAWMGQELNQIGANVVGITTVSDDADAIECGLKIAISSADIVLITGGLGPTKDDITKKTIADFFKVGMTFHQETYDRILKLFEKLKREPTQEHYDQCYMPDNALILKNKMGTAPGMWFEYKEKVIVSMPGVPYEMKYLMEFEVIPKLIKQFQSVPIAHRTVLTVGEGESRLAAKMDDFLESLPSNIKMAFLPGMGQVRLRLTGTGPDEEALHKLLDEKAAEMESLIPEYVFGRGKENLASVLGQILVEKDKTLGTAESCTGGYLAHQITSNSGSSAYFKGSVIAYDNSVKINQLSVQATTLESHGAVSEQTVKEMVAGALDVLQVDVAIAISGIAGPGGGTPEKPVGTIWLAVGEKGDIQTRKLQLGKDRMRNIQYTCVQALNMIRKFVTK